jgi:hypothetical protein
MSYYVPDAPLEPPITDLEEAFTCVICEGPIYVGEDYYDIPGVGKCCEECISDCHRSCAEKEER